MKRSRPVYRRQFLRGAGGFTLGLPFLPSLVSRQAFAQDPVRPRRPILWWMTTDHGGAFETNMFPPRSLLTTAFTIPNAPNNHQGYWGMLQGSTSGANTVLSPILTAASSRLTPALIAKMNVLWGLDVPFYLAHHTGGHLGNYARNDGNGADGQAVQGQPRPTLDHMLAWSPTFYADRTGIRERSVLYGYNRQVSWEYSNASAQSGDLQPKAIISRSRLLFDRLIDPSATQPMQPMQPTQPAAPPRPPVVDKVFEDYKRLKEGNRRISARDRQRLDDHMSQLSELQRKLNVSSGGGTGGSGGTGTGGGTRAQCSPQPTTEEASPLQTQKNGTAYARAAELYNDVIAAAFACGTTRVAVFAVGNSENATGYGGNWHQDIAHQWQNATPQDHLRRCYQLVFEKMFVDLAYKLNSIETEPGKTVLDDTLMVWSQECGMSTHDSVSIPVVTAGGAAGGINTGRYIDYRRGGGPNGPTNNRNMGLLWNHFLGSVALTMGMPAREFERWGHRGIGVPFVTRESWTPPYRQHYGDTNSAYFQMASTKLPIWTT